MQDFGVAVAMPGRGDRDRTCNLRFWRPPLYQLSYTPLERPGGIRTRVDGFADRCLAARPQPRGAVDGTRTRSVSLED